MVNLLKMIDLLYPYSGENRIKVDDDFKKIYYAYTISQRPLAFHLEEPFPLRVDERFIIVRKEDNIKFCQKFEDLVKKDVNILRKIMTERDIHRDNLKKAICNDEIDEVIRELFLLGRYGIEWYYPYTYLYKRLRRYFSPEKIDEITNKLKISDELPYYIEIYLGIKKLKNNEITLQEFIEEYGVLARSSIEPSKYEDINHLKKLVGNLNNCVYDELFLRIEENIKEKIKILGQLREIVDEETFSLLKTFSEIDTENEIIHKERARALRYLWKNRIDCTYIREYCSKCLDFRI